MEKAWINYILIANIFLLFSCNVFEKHKLDKINTSLNCQKQTFDMDYRIKNIYSHFPNEIVNDSFEFVIISPSCPPSFKCWKQRGDICLIVNRANYLQPLSGLLKNKFEDEFEYESCNNIIINLPELKYDRFPIEKCNKYIENSIPIPYFEAYNFGMGVKKTKKDIDDVTYTDYTYTVPSDLKVYVIEAQAGDFWIKNCNEKRPESLKEWKHGYSRGIATSEEENIIVFWAMIW